ncbi:MAG: M15 family metallopeptidase [Prevotellaceae bacterium]|nr:M15 family metallopeptidase [Prevotellaceae bacterium]
MNARFILWLSFMLFVSCNRPASAPMVPAADSCAAPLPQAGQQPVKDAEMAAGGLVDVATLDEGMMVQLVYATPYNFMGKILYRDVSRAYLQPDVAQMLLKAYKALKKQRPDLTFKIYDAGRPVSVQWEMWNMVKGTEWDYYVANPGKGGGMHNFGAAVDLTLVDCTGTPLAMGTPYDYFGYEANTDREEELLRTGRITARELENRLLLRKIMTDAGFRTVKSEWWHFNACPLDEAKQRYKIID